MKFGLSDSQFKILEDLLINPLKSKNAKLYIFGSRARGDNHPFSDIDVLFVEDQNNLIDLAYISNLSENLENSNLAIKVDLVNSKNLAATYLPSVEKDKILI
jgi:predicted nucleotidyltransferase